MKYSLFNKKKKNVIMNITCDLKKQHIHMKKILFILFCLNLTFLFGQKNVEFEKDNFPNKKDEFKEARRNFKDGKELFEKAMVEYMTMLTGYTTENNMMPVSRREYLHISAENYTAALVLLEKAQAFNPD